MGDKRREEKRGLVSYSVAPAQPAIKSNTSPGSPITLLAQLHVKSHDCTTHQLRQANAFASIQCFHAAMTFSNVDLNGNTRKKDIVSSTSRVYLVKPEAYVLLTSPPQASRSFFFSVRLSTFTFQRSQSYCVPLAAQVFNSARGPILALHLES